MTSQPPAFDIARLPRPDDLAQFGGQGRVYALLDASRLFGLPEQLQNGRAPFQCLFAGETAEDLADVAPYLVDITDGARLGTDLMTPGDAPWQLWDKEAGIVIVADIGLAALAKHLRRFIRVMDGADRAFFFRFWEPIIARHYLTSIADAPELVARWCRPLEGGQIAGFVVPDGPADDVLHITPGDLAPADEGQPRLAFRLRPQDYEALRSARVESDIAGLVALMAKIFPDAAKTRAPGALRHEVQRSVLRAQELGIHQRDNIFRFAAWDLHSDGAFERRDPEGRLREIVTSALPETEKMLTLKARFDALDQV